MSKPEALPAPDGEQTLGQRVRRGIGVLFGRQALVQLITLCGGIALARLLEPEEFAVFAICLYFQKTFGQLSNVGLVAALIQQPSEPTDREVRVAFTIQLALLSLVALVAASVGPRIIGLYPSLSGQGYGSLFLALVFALWIGAFRSVPCVMLERNMRYVQLGGIELLEVFVHQAVAVGLAFAGWGVWALAVGILAKAAVGSLAAFFISGWRPRLGWDLPIASRLLRFGVPLQASAIVTQIAHGMPAIVIAPIVGTAAFGLMLWGQTVGSKMLFLVEPLRRVAFNHLSRTTDDASRARVYGRYLALATTAIGAWAILVEGLGSSVLLSLYGSKWSGGLGVATLAAIAAAINSSSRLAETLLHATGRTGRGLAVVVVRTATAFGLAFLLTPMLHIETAPAVWLINSAVTTLLLSALAGKQLLVCSLRTLLSLVLAQAAGIATVRYLVSLGNQGLLTDLLATSVGLLAYSAVALSFFSVNDRRWLATEAFAASRWVRGFARTSLRPNPEARQS